MNKVSAMAATFIFLAGAGLMAVPVAAIAASEQVADVEAAWAKKEAAVLGEYKSHEEKELAEWEERKKQILKKWPTAEMPEQKTYVEYSSEDSARVKVDYESGKVVVEALVDPTSGTEDQAKNDIKKALADAMRPSKDEVLPPLELLEITTEAAKDPVPQLVEQAAVAGIAKGTDGKERKIYRVSFDLVANYIKLRATKLKPLIEDWAKKYNLDPALVYALICQESRFNPKARSWVPAYGLMQIVPRFAGKEVTAAVSGKAILPDAEYLYEPKNNVMIGTTYLQILRDKYFPNVKDAVVRTYFMICAYNGGTKRIKEALSNGTLSLKMTREVIFKKLQEIHKAETSDYLRKVTKFQADFTGL